jgi:outer membrane protein TolC
MLRGFGADVARAGRRRAASALDQAKAQGESAAAELLRATSQSYWELAFAARQLWVHQSSLDLAREQLRAVKANIDVGKQPPSAAAEVEVAIALREDDVLQAEQFALERSLELRQTLGLATGEESAALVAADPLEPRFEARDLRTAIEAARLRNPLLAAARAQIATASTEVGVARSGLLPQLDLSLSAGPLASDATVPAAFAHLVRGGGFQVQAGLTLGLSIENTAAAGQHAAAREQLHKARRVEEAIGLQIDASVARAMSALSTTERRIAVLARATDHAALDLEAERARFQAGRSSNFDVLRRQDELARAQLQQARAKADYLQLEALIDALTAAILPRFGVALR